MLARIVPSNKNPVIRNKVLLRINDSSTSVCSARLSMKISHRWSGEVMWLLLVISQFQCQIFDKCISLFKILLFI